MSSTSSIHSLADLLQKKQPLSGLLARAGALLRLEQLLHQQLQPVLRAQCKVAAFRDGRLLLVVNSGQWATHLRYQERRLCHCLQALPEFAGLQRILLKVRPPAIRHQERAPCPHPPPSAAASLRACAEDCADPVLRKVLEKLAGHADKQ